MKEMKKFSYKRIKIHSLLVNVHFILVINNVTSANIINDNNITRVLL